MEEFLGSGGGDARLEAYVTAAEDFGPEEAAEAPAPSTPQLFTLEPPAVPLDAQRRLKELAGVRLGDLREGKAQVQRRLLALPRKKIRTSTVLPWIQH